MLRPALGLCLILSACIDVPELDRAVPDWVDDTPYPKLVPLEGLQLGQLPPQDQSAEIEEDLIARADRLAQRAEAVRGPVVDQESRTRMGQGVSQ